MQGKEAGERSAISGVAGEARRHPSACVRVCACDPTVYMRKV